MARCLRGALRGDSFPAANIRADVIAGVSMLSPRAGGKGISRPVSLSGEIAEAGSMGRSGSATGPVSPGQVSDGGSGMDDGVAEAGVVAGTGAGVDEAEADSRSASS